MPNSTGTSAPVATTPTAKPPPPKHTLYTAAIIQVLDKVTAESLRFEAPVHKFVRYKGLIFLVNTCQSGQTDQPPYAAHLEVDSQPPALPGWGSPAAVARVTVTRRRVNPGARNGAGGRRRGRR